MKITNSLFVSVIVAARNEERFIGKCLGSLLNDTYPKNKLEIIVIDGASQDKTKEIAELYAKQHRCIKVVENPKKIQAVAWNIGIKKARGNIIIQIGTHAIYCPNYISKSITFLKKYGVDCVGGVLKAKPSKNTLMAEAIAEIIVHYFGSGASHKGDIKKIKEVDTVFGACYRKEVFERIGLFNEKLVRSQDFEFNMRLKKAGGKILLIPDLEAYYYPKSTLREFFHHNILDGIWAIYPLKFGAALFKIRHLLPLFFVTGFFALAILSIFFNQWRLIFWGVLAIYAAALVIFSFQIALRKKKLKLFPFLIAAFIVRHFAYGIGSFFGFLKVLFSLRNDSISDSGGRA